MNFADCLKLTSASPAQTSAANPSPSLKKSLAKAGLGIVGLAALPLLSGGLPAAPAIKMLVGLVAVCALAFFALRLLARRTQAAAATDLKVVARASLSPKNGVAILEADGRRYLVAFGDGFTTVISGEPR